MDYLEVTKHTKNKTVVKVKELLDDIGADCQICVFTKLLMTSHEYDHEEEVEHICAHLASWRGFNLESATSDFLATWGRQQQTANTMTASV